MLKERFTTAPILAHFDFEKEYILEIDSSDNVFAGIFFHYGDDGLLYPIVFFSCKYSTQKINYEIYDKELLAIIKFFEEWRLMLKEARLPVKILTCDDPYVSYDAYHISFDTILFLTHSLYNLLSCEMATNVG